MNLTANDLAILHAAQTGAVRRTGRTWHVGSLTADRAQIGRLIRGGFLTGKRTGSEARITAQGRRAILPMQTPPLGAEIVFRVDGWERTKRYRHGRIVAVDAHRVVVIPRELIVERGVPQAVEVRRPHPGAPWKGRTVTIGYYRGTPLWPAVASLLPAAWTAPVTTEPYTLERLRDVRTRLASIGAYPATTEEHASGWTYLYQIPDRIAMGGEIGEYLQRVYERDRAEIDAAMRAEVAKVVSYSLGSWTRTGQVPPLDEVLQNVPHYFPAEIVREEYAVQAPKADALAVRLRDLKTMRMVRRQ